MVRRRILDPTESAFALYGHRLRRYRDQRGWSQARLGLEAYCSGDLISKIETGAHVATPEMSARLDVIFELDDFFKDLQPLAAKSVVPAFFRPYVEYERRATSIRVFDPLYVAGLLQSEAYARQVLQTRQEAAELNRMVAARLGRQAILRRKEPPWVVVLLHEVAIRRPVGGKEITREQLQRLLDAGRDPNVTIQVVPMAAPVYPGSGFTLLSFNDEPDICFVEGAFGQGRVIDERPKVEEVRVMFDRIGSLALPVNESAEFIRSVMESG